MLSKYKRCLGLIIIVTLLLVLQPVLMVHGKTFDATVSRVVDGDSIEVQVGRKVLRVRLWGVDTPEWKQPWSKKASAFTRSLVGKRKVQLLVKDKDDYGRIVAVVFVDGENVNEQLVASGYAWVHIYYCREEICDRWRDLQQKARDAKKGLWHEKNPEPPWEWKRNNRKKRNR